MNGGWYKALNPRSSAAICGGKFCLCLTRAPMPEAWIGICSHRGADAGRSVTPVVSVSFLMVNGIVLRPELTTTSGRPAGRHHRLLFPLVGLCGFLASCLLLAMSVESDYCLPPTTVLLHPSLFGSPRLLSWNDVRAVEATCLRAGKYGPYGALQLILSEGTTLTVSLTSQLLLDWQK